MYRVKKSVKPGQRVVLKDNLKPTGRKVFLDDASQKQLKVLYELGHGFVEEYNPREEKKLEQGKESEKDSGIKVKKSGSDKS